MGAARIARVAFLYALLSATTVDAECLLSEVSIYSENVWGLSGCYNETKYFGVYDTMVWTLDGVDIAPGGTTAIVADLQNDSSGDPTWSIGAVVSNPENTWSDGYIAGLEVTTLTCTGTSPFWETKDPTEETLWECDSNNDGTRTARENDFNVTCGCPDVNGVIPTPAPALPAQASRTVEPTPVSTAADLASPTILATPSPAISKTIAPAHLPCNVTLASEALEEVAGCYAEAVSSNSRGRWLKPDGSASIEWKDPEDDDTSGWWVIQILGVGSQDETKCINTEDEDDPTTLLTNDWLCDNNFDSMFSVNETGYIDALNCNTESCEVNTSIETVQEDSGESDNSTVVIVASTVVGGLILAGLIIVGLYVIKRRTNRKKGVEPAAEKTVTTDPDAPPVPIPIFEPWGTRPPP